MKLKLPVLSEADVSGQVKDYLKAHGWRPVRMQRTVVPGQFQSGEPGQADFQFVYYLKLPQCPALTLTLWVEFKKKNSRMRCKCAELTGTRKRCTACDQKHWRDTERARGAVVWSGVDDLDWFIDNYELTFNWLHAGETARGQLDMFAGMITGG